MRDFILGGSKITADGHCSHEIKKHLLLGRKAMTNVDSILKSRYISLPAQRDGMGREEGGGFRMGSTCIPVMDSF